MDMVGDKVVAKISVCVLYFAILFECYMDAYAKCIL